MFKTLLKHVKQYKTASLLTPVFIMLEVILDVLIPFVTAKLIDNGISAGHMPSVYKYGLIMLVMAFLSMIAAIMAGRYASYYPDRTRSDSPQERRKRCLTTTRISIWASASAACTSDP